MLPARSREAVSLDADRFHRNASAHASSVRKPLSALAANVVDKLGKYEIRGTLGKGAMGIVYDGFDPIIERRVAIKTIAKASMDPAETAQMLGRFKREAQAAGRLNHPNIVSIHDYGEDDGLAFIAMEFIHGKELKSYFDSQERFDLRHLARIVCDVLDALDHAHRNGVVHRDIKPANIMITEEGRVKVADFGVARIESSLMTQVGTRIGTPAYMSPEQHQGLAVSGRSDLFSVGVILYQFLTGERPFTGEGYVLIQQILLQNPISPSQINPDIPRALDAVTMKALAKRPEDRYATAREFAQAFREAVAGESIGSGVDFPLVDGALPPNAPGVMPQVASARGTRVGGASVIGSGSSLSDVSLEAELEYWKEIKDSTASADFEIFLQVFPESRFAPLARRRLDRLEGETRSARDGDQQRQQASAERSGSDAEQKVRGASAEPPVAGLRADRRESESHPVRQAEEQGQPEEERTLLLAEADSRRTAEADIAEQAREQAQDRKSAEAPLQSQRHDDWRLPHLDAREPKLTLSARDAAVMSEADLGPPFRMQPGATSGDVPRLKTVSGPLHARHRAANPVERDPLPPRAGNARASHKRSRMPVAAALAAVLICGGWWSATRPEFAPIVGALTTTAGAIVGQVQQHGQSSEVKPAQQARQGLETARMAEDQRRNEEALQAERERQLASARQKEDAARAAALQHQQLQAERERQLALARQRAEAVRIAAAQHYQRALALLDQGQNGEGVRLLRQLAYDGYGPAAATLGDLYSAGERVLLDRQEASHFYAIAERNGVRIDRPPVVRR